MGNLVNRVENPPSSQVCSVQLGYQDLDVDINDTLCQGYSLLAYLGIKFDTTPSRVATRTQKFQKQLAMINMYKMILDSPAFIKEFNEIVKNRANRKLWEDTVNSEDVFYINMRYKGSGEPVIENIKHVLAIWERWGWQFFVGDGTCYKEKKDGGSRGRRRSNSRSSRSRRSGGNNRSSRSHSLKRK